MAMNWDDPELEGALKESEADDRLGDHTVVVDSVETKTWDDGNVSYNLTCMIETARFAKFYARFGTPRSGADLKAMKAAIASDSDMKRYRAISADTRNQQMLAKEYGLRDIADVGKGFRFAAKLVKNKDGYVRMAQVLPRAKMAGETVAPSATVPF